jgi:dTDP-glucose 4,6-dehydratase
MTAQTFLVTGGAGFIGSAVVRHLIADTPARVVVADKLTYAGNLDNLAPVAADPRYTFAHADIGDGPTMRALLERHRPDVVMNLAAESHVDRSIDDPKDFIDTNIVGTFILLQEALR